MADDLVQEISEDLLKCAICMERYEQPKILPCFHTFCESCLELYVNKKGGNSFPCPSCRTNVDLPKNGVSGLPTNFYVGSLNEKFVRLEMQKDKEEEVVSCDECRDSEKRVDQICEKCEKAFCDNCAEDHSKWSIFNGHEVITINAYKRRLKDKGLQKPEKDGEIEMCARHSKEQAGLFCDTCKVVICFRCTEENHSRPDHDYKSLQTQCAKTKQLLTHMFTQSEKMLTQCTDIAEARLKALGSIRENASHYKERIKEESKRIKKIVDGEEKKLLEEIAKYERRIFHFYQVRITEISDWRESIEISQNVIKQVIGKSCGKAEFLTDGQYLGETFANMQKHHETFQKTPQVDQIAFAAPSKGTMVPSVGNIWIPRCIGMKATGNGSRDAIVVCEDAASFDIYIGNVLSENGLHLKHIFWFVRFHWSLNQRRESKLCFAVDPGNCVYLGQDKSVACFDMVAGTSIKATGGDICYKTTSPIKCMDFDDISKLLFIGVSSTRIVGVDPEKRWVVTSFIEIPIDLYSPISLAAHQYGALFICESQSLVYEANFKRQCGFLVSCPTAIGGHDFKPVRIFRTPYKFTGNEMVADVDLFQVGRKQGHYALNQASAQLEFAWFVLWVAAGKSSVEGEDEDNVAKWAIAEYNTENTDVVAILHQPSGMRVPVGIVPFQSDDKMDLTLCDKTLAFRNFTRIRSNTSSSTGSSPSLYKEVV